MMCYDKIFQSVDMLARELNFDNLQTDHRYIKCREAVAYQITYIIVYV